MAAERKRISSVKGPCGLLSAMHTRKGKRQKSEAQTRQTHSNDIPPSGPLLKHLLYRCQSHPLPPTLFHHQRLEERAQEQQRRQRQSAECLWNPQGPVPQRMERVTIAVASIDGQQGEGGERGDSAGEADRGDAGADNGRRVARKCGRGTCFGRCVEGQDIEQCVEYLIMRQPSERGVERSADRRGLRGGGWLWWWLWVGATRLYERCVSWLAIKQHGR